MKFRYEYLIFPLYFAILFIASPKDATYYAGGDKALGLLYGMVTLNSDFANPVYTSLGWLVTRLPIHDGLAVNVFLSIIPSVISSIIVYMIVFKLTDRRFYATCASLALMSSWIFFVQTLKLESYPLMAMLISLSYLGIVKKNNYLSVLPMVVAMWTHFMIAMVVTICFIGYYKSFRSMWYVLLLSFIMYPIFHYLHKGGFYSYYTAGAWNAVFGGHSDTIVENVTRGLALTVGGIGIALYPIYKFFINAKLRHIVPLLVPLLIFSLFSSFLPEWQWQLFAGVMPLAAISAGIGMSYIAKKSIQYCVAGLLVLSIIPLPMIFQLDNNPTSARVMIEELDYIDPDSNYVVMWGGTYRDFGCFGSNFAVDYYNYFNGDRVRSLHIGHESSGFNVPESYSTYFDFMDKFMVMNPGVDIYYYRLSENSTLKCELISWKAMSH